MGGGGGSAPTTVGGSNLGPYTQSIVNQMNKTLPSQTVPQLQLQQQYDQMFGTGQPSFQQMANANALRMIDALPMQVGKFSIIPPSTVTVPVTPTAPAAANPSNRNRDPFNKSRNQ